jgi:histidinol dehydrogenase
MQTALENLKEAVEFVNPTMPEHLVIVGREQLREALARIAALGAENVGLTMALTELTERANATMTVAIARLVGEAAL